MSLLLLADVKPHLKITQSTDDVVLQAKLDAAEAWVSEKTGGSGGLASTTVTETVYGRGAICVTKVPLLSVTSVTGENSGALTLTDLSVDLRAGVIRPKGVGLWTIWPDYYTVVYSTGYASAAALSQELVEAVRLMTQHFYSPQRGGHIRGTGGDPTTQPDAFTRAQQILEGLRMPGFA